MTIFRFRWFLILPVLIFLALCLIFWRGLDLDPRHLPTVLLNKPLPAFSLPDLMNPNKPFTDQELHGHISLLNVWASWCISCQVEHPILIDIAHQQHIPIYGLDYKDTPEAANALLKQYGNPFQAIGMDQNGKVAINLGVYGTPETFVIDQNGIIRYKYIGPVTGLVWQNTIQPEINRLLEKLKKENQ